MCFLGGGFLLLYYHFPQEMKPEYVNTCFPIGRIGKPAFVFYLRQLVVVQPGF